MRTKRINGELATEHNALWLNKRVVVNTFWQLSQYLRQIAKKNKNITYEGGGEASDYFILPGEVRLRISNHNVVWSRSISDIYITEPEKYTGLSHYEYGRPVPYKRGELRIVPDFEKYYNIFQNLKKEFNF